VCEVEIEILEKKLKGRCGVLNNCPYDILLGLDFLSRTSFILDFNSLQLINIDSSRGCSSSLYFVERFLSVTDTIGPHGSLASHENSPELNLRHHDQLFLAYEQPLVFQKADLNMSNSCELASACGPQQVELINQTTADMFASSPLIQDSRSIESGTDGSNKRAEIFPPGTAVFADIDDDDGLEDKEMLLPSKASLENKWPFKEDFESTVLDKLCIGPELSLEQRVQLLNVCRKYPEVFRP
jgi:hypothetical protein